MSPSLFSRRGLLVGASAAIAGAACAEPPSLKAAAKRAGRRFGCAVEPQTLAADGDFRDLVAQQCDLLIPENAMKWNALRPSADAFDFAAADAVIAAARAQGAQVHGHCLVWHEAMPNWAAGPIDGPTARDRLEAHVGAVAGRYRGAVASWDVINEAVERNDRRADGLRRSLWLEALGPDYLLTALDAAHRAAPQARLAISDYGLEYDHVTWMVEKRGTMLALLRDLLRRGAPLHALSIQGHLLGAEPASFGLGLRRFLSDVADLGLEIYVTELDVNEQTLTGSAAARDAIVADIYRRFVDTILNEPAVRFVATWGLSDRYTSKTEMFPHADGLDVRPLPFDRDLRPKAAARALQAAFQRAA